MDATTGITPATEPDVEAPRAAAPLCVCCAELPAWDEDGRCEGCVDQPVPGSFEDMVGAKW